MVLDRMIIELQFKDQKELDEVITGLDNILDHIPVDVPEYKMLLDIIGKLEGA